MGKKDINKTDNSTEIKAKKAVEQISEKLRQGKDAEAVRLFVEYRSEGKLPRIGNIVGYLNNNMGEEVTNKLIAAILHYSF